MSELEENTADVQAGEEEEQPDVPSDEWEDVLGSGALMKRIIVGGDGPRPADRQEVVVHAVGRLADSGTIFHDTRSNNEPLCFQTADTTTDIIPGVILAVRLMFLHEKSEYRLSSRHAYGSNGNAELGVPPNSDVIYELELVELGYLEPRAGEMETEELIAALTKRRERGNKLYYRQDFERALQCYEMCLAMIKDADITDRLVTAQQIHILNNKAQTLSKLGKRSEAKQAYVEVLELDPHNFKALLLVGTIASEQNEFEEATQALNRAQRVQDTFLVRQRIRDLTARIQAHKDKERELYSGWTAKLKPLEGSEGRSTAVDNSKGEAEAEAEAEADDEIVPESKVDRKDRAKESREQGDEQTEEGSALIDDVSPNTVRSMWKSTLLSLAVALACIVYVYVTQTNSAAPLEEYQS